jgi:hypothetical protein
MIYFDIIPTDIIEIILSKVEYFEFESFIKIWDITFNNVRNIFRYKYPYIFSRLQIVPIDTDVNSDFETLSQNNMHIKNAILNRYLGFLQLDDNLLYKLKQSMTGKMKKYIFRIEPIIMQYMRNGKLKKIYGVVDEYSHLINYLNTNSLSEVIYYKYIIHDMLNIEYHDYNIFNTYNINIQIDHLNLFNLVLHILETVEDIKKNLHITNININNLSTIEKSIRDFIKKTLIYSLGFDMGDFEYIYFHTGLEYFYIYLLLTNKDPIHETGKQFYVNYNFYNEDFKKFVINYL